MHASMRDRSSFWLFHFFSTNTEYFSFCPLTEQKQRVIVRVGLAPVRVPHDVYSWFYKRNVPNPLDAQSGN
jgi:hypothetical protein